MDFPQYTVEVDAAKCMRAGVSTDEVMNVLGSYYGGNYASNFNQFGKIYRVMIQADPRYRLVKGRLPMSMYAVAVRWLL